MINLSHKEVDNWDNTFLFKSLFILDINSEVDYLFVPKKVVVWNKNNKKKLNDFQCTGVIKSIFYHQRSTGHVQKDSGKIQQKIVSRLCE